MPVSYSCDEVARLIVRTASDPVTLQDWRDAFDQLDNDPVPERMQVHATIVDLRKRKSFDRGQMVRALAARRRERRGPPMRVAFIVASAVSFGMVRMAEAYAAEAMEARIFQDMETAWAWALLSPDTGTPPGPVRVADQTRHRRARAPHCCARPGSACTRTKPTSTFK